MLKRLLDRQLKMLDDSEARLATYLKDPPQNLAAPEHAPALLAFDVAVVGLVIGIPALIIRRRRNRKS